MHASRHCVATSYGHWPCTHINVTVITQFVQINCMHCVTTSYTVLLSGQFLLLVSATLLEKKTLHLTLPITSCPSLIILAAKG